MTIEIRYFAGVRETLGTDRETVDDARLPDEPIVEDVWDALVERHPRLLDLKDHLRVAVNRDFADWDAEVESGDEVALIPPVSGGSGDSVEADDADPDSEQTEWTDDSGRFLLTTEPLDLERVCDAVRRPDAGAIVTFEGVVRDHTGDRDVEFLEYEAYPEMALEKLVQTAGEIADEWTEAKTAIHHRFGHLEIEERAVVIAVSSPHRLTAFEACKYAIDRLKEIVPIWKKEVSPEGDEWVGFGP